MTEFLGKSFVQKQAMWGIEASAIAILVEDYFAENKLKEILIWGIGYGRNAKPFINRGMNITGIKIFNTAISIARQNGLKNKIYHGTVADMPFDN